MVDFTVFYSPYMRAILIAMNENIGGTIFPAGRHCLFIHHEYRDGVARNHAWMLRDDYENGVAITYMGEETVPLITVDEDPVAVVGMMQAAME